jgi:hypothetical protein
MYDVPQEHWVISEEREHGESWPLMVVADGTEAAQLVHDLRARGRHVDAVQIDDAAADDLSGTGRRDPR